MSILRGESKDILQENIEHIKQLFPEVCCEDKIDFDKLKQVLGEYVDDDKERYNFTWNGKGRSLRLSQTPSLGTLRPCKEESKDWDSTQNLYIEGDNLEVLKLLQKSYYGKVKMIYIDPPYNTGHDFVYKDDYNDNLNNYKMLTGQIDSDGNSFSTNQETNGRFHTDWLNMMYSRIRLARNLIAKEGFIAISIAEEELCNLWKMCNEIFGEANFRNILAVRRYDKNLNLQFVEEGLSSLNVGLEYILIYSRNSNTKMKAVYKDASETRSKSGYWKGFWNNADRPTMRYELLGVIPEEGQWKWQKSVAEEAVNNYRDWEENYSNISTLEEYWVNTGRIKKFIRRNLSGNGKNKGIEHWVPPTEHILRNSNWSDILVSKSIGMDIVFDNPKNIELLKAVCKLTNVETHDIILDFFSGSATTAHAVMQLNAEDGGDRRFIMVQLPEVCGEKTEAYKAGYKNICEIGKERIRRAGGKIKAQIEEENAQMKLGEEPKKIPDIGFRVFKLDSSNLKKWQPDYDDLEKTLLDSIENYVEGRSKLDVVYEIILKMGLDLTYPVDELDVNGRKIYSVAFGALMICLDDHITKEIADGMISLYQEYQPELWKVVFKDNGFENDSAKTNIKEQLKVAGLEEDAFTTI